MSMIRNNSQRVLLALTQAGASREESYRLVQRNAMKVWRGEGDFLATTIVRAFQDAGLEHRRFGQAGVPSAVYRNDGEVIVAQGMFYEGNLVVINHGLQFYTQYMHLSKIEVKVGDRVKKGQRIGLSGATGRVTGPHLHLGVRWQGEYVDPVILLRLQLPAIY